MERREDKPSEESVRLAMDQAWRDHHHARDQTWRALQMETVLGAGLVTVDIQFHDVLATACAGVLAILAALSGFMISLHHRKLERRKFIHIINAEEWLGLHRDDLIPTKLEPGEEPTRPDVVKDAAVSAPERLRIWHIVNPFCQNTALFIVRMHVAIMAFAALIIVLRACRTPA